MRRSSAMIVLKRDRPTMHKERSHLAPNTKRNDDYTGSDRPEYFQERSLWTLNSWEMV